MVGLCHGYSHVYSIAKKLGIEKENLTFQMSGPNHFLWLNKGHSKDKDFLGLLDQRLAQECLKDEDRPFGKIHEDFYRRHGVIGIGDTLNWTGACWPWFYHADNETEMEFNDYIPMDGWNGYFNFVEKAAADIIALAKDPNRSVKNFFGDIGADDLIVPLVESLACNTPRMMFVNMLNKGGLVPGMPEDFGIEIQALCQRDEIRPIQADPLPKAMVAYILRDRVAPVEMELEALRTGKMNYLEELVLMDKWAVSIKQVRGFIKEILDLPYHGEMKAYFNQ